MNGLITILMIQSDDVALAPDSGMEKQMPITLIDICFGLGCSLFPLLLQFSSFSKVCLFTTGESVVGV